MDDILKSYFTKKPKRNSAIKYNVSRNKCNCKSRQFILSVGSSNPNKIIDWQVEGNIFKQNECEIHSIESYNIYLIATQ